MIYGKAFETPLQDGRIAPDFYYSRSRLGGALTDLTANNGLALLLSCKQASEEACNILYSRHTFYFDDRSQHNRHGTLGFKLDGSYNRLFF